MQWWYFWLNNDRMVDIKAWVAGVGAAVLLWYLLAERLPRFRPYRRVRDFLLAGLGLVSVACWFNLGRFHFDPFIHYYEFYHYYLGAKYYRELGYTRIYECTIVAEAQYTWLGPALKHLRIRDLKTNELTTPDEILDNQTRCTDHFTPDRWKDFMRDADFFRRASQWGYWSSGLEDNGFNGTPVWALFAGIFAEHSGPMNDTLLFRLGLLDPALLLVMWLFVLWSFGWRTTCVALLFWGTNFAARYFWNGGAFLRMDWLAATIISVALMHKRRYAGAGVALALGVLLRVFPVFVAVPLALKVAVDCWRARKLVLGRAERRFAAGALVTVLTLVPLATWHGGGVECWKGFIANSKKHLDTPLTNNMGLKAVIAYSTNTDAEHLRNYGAFDPFHAWKEAQRQNYKQRRLLFVFAVAAFLGLLTLAALGCGFVLVAAELTCYYFSILLALGFLWPRVRWSGIALCLASTASCLLPRWPVFFGRMSWDDQMFPLITLVWLALIAALTYELARPVKAAVADDAARAAPAEP
jgi:hypothetical protein